jgi:hypothetical protein
MLQGSSHLTSCSGGYGRGGGLRCLKVVLSQVRSGEEDWMFAVYPGEATPLRTAKARGHAC